MPIAPWLALASALTAFAAPAAPAGTADALPLVLTWEAPGECPQASEVVALVSTVLRRRARALPEPLEARATVTRASSGAWRLQLELRSNDGQQLRVLQAEECPLLARAAALVVAVQLDPLAPGRTLQAAVLRESAEAPVPSLDPLATQVAPAAVPVVASSLAPAAPLLAPTVSSVAPAAGSVPPPIPPPPREWQPRTPPPSRTDPAFDELDAPPPASTTEASTSEAPKPPRIAGHLRLEGGLEVGLLPGVGGLVGVVGGVALRRLRLEVGLMGSPVRSKSLPDGKISGRLDRLAGVLRVCPGWTGPRARVTIAGCLGGEAGAIRAVAVGVADPSPRWAPWAALSLGPALRVRLAGPVGVRLGVEGVLALARPTFTLGAGGEQLFQVTPAGLRITLAIDLQFVARKR